MGGGVLIRVTEGVGGMIRTEIHRVRGGREHAIGGLCGSIGDGYHSSLASRTRTLSKVYR